MASDENEKSLDDERLSRLRETLARHPVSFAMVFGSAARGDSTERSDLDIAVEFSSLRPDDDGYSEAYLRLRSDLDDAFPEAVDVVDVHATPPSFARSVFTDGRVVIGSESRRTELERERAGDPPSLTTARDRVAAAVERLREGTDIDRGDA